MLVIEPTTGHQHSGWPGINWSKVEASVRRLQGRIYRAAENRQWKKVKSLQKLLVRSLAAKFLSIRQVTMENRGKKTPGIDGVVCDTPAKRLALLKEGLTLGGYKPKPVRRVYIPKANGKQRPLGIPTVKDRVMQALVKLSMEPEWESRFEVNSYGFRPGRCCMDAITAIAHTLRGKNSSKWVLDADISGCFDNIKHEAILDRTPVFATTIRRWLKSGVIEWSHMQPTEAGTPQGGIISPLLANIALDGLERLFGCTSASGRQLCPSVRRGDNKGINLIRYADDFVITAPSREVISEYVIPRLEQFLATKGLQLSEAKTSVVHVDKGFDFLGFTIKRYSGKIVLVRPAKANVKAHIKRIKDLISKYKQATQTTLINILNPIIGGWSNYYRHGNSKRTFSYVDHQIWKLTWYWAKRRHPNKSKHWVKYRYFPGQDWMFRNDSLHLYRHKHTPITRHIKVRGASSPHNPDLLDYWEQRRRRRQLKESFYKQRRETLFRQQNSCAVCGAAFQHGDPLHDKQAVYKTLDSPPQYRQLVHQWCRMAQGANSECP